MIDRSGQGQAAEDLACAFLRDRGLHLLQRNYRCRRGELDLVMRQNDTTVFVEVRFRTPSTFADAVASVDRRKQSRLVAAAQHYLQHHPDAARGPCRFDVIAVTPQGNRHHIEWITNAIES